MKNKKNNYYITEEESKRIDILKVWLALMVLYIHSYSEKVVFTTESVQLGVPDWLHTLKYTLSQSISSCAVPAFFVISSILLYRKKIIWKNNIKKKMRTLVIPYFCLNTFWICFLWLIQLIDQMKQFFLDSGLIISEWDIFDFVNAYIGYTGYPILYPLWFIRDLFVLNILAGFIPIVIERYPRIVFGILSIMWLLGIPTGIFCLETESLCFFCLGYYIVKYNIRLSSIDKINKYIVIFVYWVLIALDVITRGAGNIHGVIHRVSIVVGIIFWFRCTTRISNAKWKHNLLFISRYSFCVYIFHEMSLTVLKKLGVMIFPYNVFFQALQYFMIPMIVFMGCIMAGVLLDRFMPKIYSILMGKHKNT